MSDDVRPGDIRIEVNHDTGLRTVSKVLAVFPKDATVTFNGVPLDCERAVVEEVKSIEVMEE